MLGINHGHGVAQIGGIVGDQNIRRRIGAELAALRNELQATPRDFSLFDTITLWLNSFSKGLRNLDLEGVIAKYVREIIKILCPLSFAHFGLGPPKIIRDIIEKMRSRASLLYSEEFDQQAVRILSSAQPEEEYKAFEESDEELDDFDAELLEALRFIEEGNAIFQGHMDVEAINGALELQRSIQQNMQRALMALEEEESQWDRALAKGQEDNRLLRNEIEAERVINHQEAMVIEERVIRFNQRAENLEIKAMHLEEELSRSSWQMSEAERDNAQLQIDITRLRAQREKNKSSWLKELAAIGASIAISLALQTPVHVIV